MGELLITHSSSISTLSLSISTMHLSRKFSVLLAVLALAGCASVSRTDPVPTKVFSSAAEAAKELTPVVTIARGKDIDVKIESTSPKMVGTRSPNFFEVVGIQGKAQEPFTITIAARCDCLGFRKQSVYPVATLLGSNMQPLGTVESANPKVRVLRGVFPSNEVFKLILVADNTDEGKKIGEVGAYIGPVVAFNIPERVYPTGKVEVNFEDIKP